MRAEGEDFVAIGTEKWSVKLCARAEYVRGVVYLRDFEDMANGEKQVKCKKLKKEKKTVTEKLPGAPSQNALSPATFKRKERLMLKSGFPRIFKASGTINLSLSLSHCPSPIVLSNGHVTSGATGLDLTDACFDHPSRSSCVLRKAARRYRQSPVTNS